MLFWYYHANIKLISSMFSLCGVIHILINDTQLNHICETMEFSALFPFFLKKYFLVG